MWILNNLKTIAAVAAALVVAYALHSLSMAAAEAEKRKALSEQAALYTSQCDADKAKTKEANDALQKSADDIAARLARYKRLHPNTCVMPQADGTLPAGGGAGHAGGDGVSTDWLREYAAQCEAYRRQRIVLEGLLR